MSNKNCSIHPPPHINKVKMNAAAKYIAAAKEISKQIDGGGVVSAKLGSMYTKIAQIIASSMLNLGLNTCAYIISKFPAKLREPVINMLKKDAELFAQKEKMEAQFFAQKEKMDDQLNEENKKIYEENQKVFNAVGGGKACSSLKKDDCIKNTDDCSWINSKCVSKQEIDSWNQAKMYTLQLVPEMNLNDFKYTEGISGKACIGFSIKAIRWGLICAFVCFFSSFTLAVAAPAFVGASLAYDFAAYIAHRIMYPNYKQQKGFMAHVDVAADNVANYLKSKEASLMPSAPMPSAPMPSAKKSSAKKSTAKKSSAKKSSTKAINRRSKSQKMTSL